MAFKTEVSSNAEEKLINNEGMEGLWDDIG